MTRRHCAFFGFYLFSGRVLSVRFFSLMFDLLCLLLPRLEFKRFFFHSLHRSAFFPSSIFYIYRQRHWIPPILFIYMRKTTINNAITLNAKPYARLYLFTFSPRGKHTYFQKQAYTSGNTKNIMRFYKIAATSTNFQNFSFTFIANKIVFRLSSGQQNFNCLCHFR